MSWKACPELKELFCVYGYESGVTLELLVKLFNCFTNRKIESRHNPTFNMYLMDLAAYQALCLCLEGKVCCFSGCLSKPNVKLRFGRQ